MNAGFASLDTLKVHLLAESLRSDKQFDKTILAIGLGMAAQIEKFCNRKFARQLGCMDTLAADRVNFLLSRYPIEQVSLVELKLTEAAGWVEQDATFYNTIDKANGIVMLPDGADAGPYYAQVRFTYDGGYFWDTASADAGPTPTPAGAAELPTDLKLAWLLQCQQVWSVWDKLGVQIIGGDKPTFVTSSLTELKLIPNVAAAISPYVRYSMV